MPSKTLSRTYCLTDQPGLVTARIGGDGRATLAIDTPSGTVVVSGVDNLRGLALLINAMERSMAAMPGAKRSTTP